MSLSVIARSAARRNDAATEAGGRQLDIQLDRHGPADAGPRDDNRRRRSCRAFTIVEVAMAVLLLALALTTSLMAMQSAFLQFDTARNLEIAANMLQCEMEKERLFTWAEASDATYVPVIDPSFAGNPAVAGRFTLSRTVALVAGHGGQMVQITLRVTWRGYDGRSLTRSYTTYYTQGGLHAYLYGT